MSSGLRRSIAKTASVSGRGVHTGASTTLRFSPADPGQGVVFKRIDLPGQPEVPARAEYVESADRRTVLARNGVSVSTVEHVLAAVAALQIDDLIIELDGPEPPICDGSAAPYYQALMSAEPRETRGEPIWYRPAAPLVVREGEASYLVGPKQGLRLTVTVEWPHPLIGRQSRCFDFSTDVFTTELAGARTFAFAAEMESLRQQGLAAGADPSAGILLTEKDVANTALRWPDEFVRHKAADLLGDLCLAGGRVEADVVAFKPSHKGNIALARAIRRAAGTRAPAVMGIEEILGVIPHRQPMLLVDRVLEIEPGRRIVGIKNVTINEPFFQGHFPGRPIMPGVLVIEAMAQVGGLLLLGEVEHPERKLVYFMSIDNAKFRRPVVPGDQIRFELEMIQFRGRTCKMRGVGYVDGQVVAEADLMARVVDR